MNKNLLIIVILKNMPEFKKLVIKIILTIPKGKVMTYGQIAALAGSPRAARQVAAILRTSTDSYDLPWHRVVNAQGQASTHQLGFGDLQEALLKRENVIFKEGKLELKEYRWQLNS